MQNTTYDMYNKIIWPNGLPTVLLDTNIIHHLHKSKCAFFLPSGFLAMTTHTHNRELSERHESFLSQWVFTGHVKYFSNCDIEIKTRNWDYRGRVSWTGYCPYLDFLSSLGIWILFGYSQLLGGNDDRYGGNQERMTMTLLRDSCGLVECLPRREPIEIRRDIRHVE